MKCFLFIFVTVGVLNTLYSEDVNENSGNAFPVSIVSSEEHQPEAQGENSEPVLSSVEIADIHDLAKNISHAKGIWRENIDGNDKKEVRRSIVKKATIASESGIMKELLLMFESTEDKSILLDILQQMEDLVHQYDVAVSFANMGGLKIISPLLFSNDDKIVSSIALVLGSAMQSNPTVQKFAMDQNVGRKLLHLLSHKSPQVVPRIVYAISSFLRNSPDAQEEFLSQDGVSRLSDVLKSSSVITATKLKIISLLNDLAVEQKTAKHDLENRSHEQMHAFRRSFAAEILKHHICIDIAGFLELEDYDSHQKVIDAMLSLDGICHKYFKIDAVKDRLKILLKNYFPEKYGKDSWIADIDEELRSALYSGLVVLYEKVNDGQISLSSDKYLTKHFEHSEL